MTNSIFTKVVHCKYAKEIWDKLQNIYEGDEKIKKVKLQVYRVQFEILQTKYGETIATYFLWVEKVINTITGLGEIVDELFIVGKILKTFPMRFDSKMFALEERKEMRAMTNQSSMKEVVFKSQMDEEGQAHLKTNSNEE